MIKRSVRLELDAILNDLNMNLSNNYKDLAHDALKKLHTVLEQFYSEGMLKEKDYRKYKQLADDYSRRMADYHH